MNKQGETVYQMEAQYIKVNRNTGKEYKVWKFLCWSPIMENLEVAPSKQKGKWLIVETPDGLVRYNTELPHTVDYGTPEEEDDHAQFEEGIEVEEEPKTALKTYQFTGTIDGVEFEPFTIEASDWYTARRNGENDLFKKYPNTWITTDIKEITVEAEPANSYRLIYDVSYDSVTIVEEQREIVNANSLDEARYILIKRLEAKQPGVEVFIHGGFQIKRKDDDLANRIKRDTLEQRLSAIQKAMGICGNMATYKELASEHNKVQDQITQLMEVK